MKSTISKNCKSLLSKYTIYFILLGMIVIMSILRPNNFPTLSNLRNVLRQMTTIGILSLGVSFCIIGGGANMSGGAIIGLTGVVAATYAQLIDRANPALGTAHPILLAFVIPLLIGAFCGLVNGVLISYFNMPPFIATLGMMQMARGAALMYTGGTFVSGVSGTFEVLGSGDIFGIPVSIILYLVCIIVAAFILHKTRFGTYVYAVGGNEKAAIVSGINAKRIKTATYVIAGIFAAIAGLNLVGRTMSGQPNAGDGYDLDAITCAVIGGTSMKGGQGTIVGTVVGALIIGLLQNSLTMLQIDANAQKVVRGLVIVVAVLIDMNKNSNKR